MKGGAKMDYYSFCVDSWTYGWCTKEELHEFVELGSITEEEYQGIIKIPQAM